MVRSEKVGRVRTYQIDPGGLRIAEERIVYSSALYEGEHLATVSLTTVEFTPADHGTRLLLVEQGAFLDGREDPGWRERGTGGWLDALADELRRADEHAPAEGSP